MAVIKSGSAKLADARTTSGDTDILDRRAHYWNKFALVQVTTLAGTSASFAINGSLDSSTWYSLPYADSADMKTFSVASFSQSTATTKYKVIPACAWRYLKVTASSVTGVTYTVYAFTGLEIEDHRGIMAQLPDGTSLFLF